MALIFYARPQGVASPFADGLNTVNCHQLCLLSQLPSLAQHKYSLGFPTSLSFPSALALPNLDPFLSVSMQDHSITLDSTLQYSCPSCEALPSLLVSLPC